MHHRRLIALLFPTAASFSAALPLQMGRHENQYRARDKVRAESWSKAGTLTFIKVTSNKCAQPRRPDAIIVGALLEGVDDLLHMVLISEFKALTVDDPSL